MLTGKDVYEAILFGESDIAGKWDKLNTFDKLHWETTASVLNGTHIAPLQGLVRDYMEFSKYATPLLKRGRLEWEAESEALAQRAQSLLTPKEP